MAMLHGRRPGRSPSCRTDEQRIHDLFHDPARADVVVRRQAAPEFEDIGAASNQTATARLIWQPRGYDPHLAKWLHRIDVPTLLVWGANDRVYPPAFAAAYQKLIRGAQLAIIADWRAPAPHRASRRHFVAALGDFLEHDPEKRAPVSEKDHAQMRYLKRTAA